MTLFRMWGCGSEAKITPVSFSLGAVQKWHPGRIFLLFSAPRLLWRTPHPFLGNGYMVTFFTVLAGCFCGAKNHLTNTTNNILVTSSFHLPISSASSGSLYRNSQRNFPPGACISWSLLQENICHLGAWNFISFYTCYSTVSISWDFGF